MKEEMTFAQRKEAALREARAQGIVDVVQASTNDNVSIDTLELATRLTKKHAKKLHKRLDARRKAQKK